MGFMVLTELTTVFFGDVVLELCELRVFRVFWPPDRLGRVDCHLGSWGTLVTSTIGDLV